MEAKVFALHFRSYRLFYTGADSEIRLLSWDGQMGVMAWQTNMGNSLSPSRGKSQNPAETASVPVLSGLKVMCIVTCAHVHCVTWCYNMQGPRLFAVDPRVCDYQVLHFGGIIAPRLFCDRWPLPFLCNDAFVMQRCLCYATMPLLCNDDGVMQQCLCYATMTVCQVRA